MTSTCNIIASHRTWLESAAVEQLRAVARWQGMLRVVGLPDLHPGKGAPIGAACSVQALVYPQLVGSDIGCGMAVWTTDLPIHRLKIERVEKRLDLDGSYEGGLAALQAAGVAEEGFEDSVGTIGGDNHFFEIQRVNAVYDEARLLELGIDTRAALLVAHSGSRGLGTAILRRHTDRDAAAPLVAASDDGREYLLQHDRAVTWARVNRRIIAARALQALGCNARHILDICHNSVVPCPAEGEDVWLHRKGAAPADEGPVIIPGSRGDFSYLVEPTNATGHSLYSLAHGAGRKWERSAAKGKLGPRANAAALTRTRLGSRVICEDKALLFEEAPEAYKPISQVIDSLVDAGLIRLLAELRPVLTYKTRKR